MKLRNILAGFLLITSISSFARGNDEPAIATGSFTFYAGTAFPSYLKVLGGFTDGQYVGPFHLGIQNQVLSNWNVGLQFSYSNANSAWMDFTDNNSNVYSYKYDISLITILVNADYTWLNRNHVVLYSGAGFGYGAISGKASFSDNVNHSDEVAFSGQASTVAYHVRLFGAKVNIVKTLGIYGDVGFGWNGIAEVGIKYSIGGNPED